MATQARQTLTEALKALQRNPGNPEAVIASFEAKAAEREREIDKLMAEMGALRQIVNGMRTLLGEQAAPERSPEPTSAAPESNGIRPEGMEAVRRIMKDGGVWTGKQILEEMKRRGWESRESQNPIRPTEAAINRLWKVKGELERVGRGQYRYVGPPSARIEDPTDKLRFPNGNDS